MEPNPFIRAISGAIAGLIVGVALCLFGYVVVAFAKWEFFQPDWVRVRFVIAFFVMFITFVAIFREDDGEGAA